MKLTCNKKTECIAIYTQYLTFINMDMSGGYDQIIHVSSRVRKFLNCCEFVCSIKKSGGEL